MSATKSAAARPAIPGSASRRRTAAVPGTAPTSPDPASAALDALAAQAEAAFRVCVDTAVRDAHAAGVPVAILGPDGCPAWLHPDGTTSPADPSGPVPRR